MKIVLTSISLALALSACGADHVEAVKNASIEDMEDKTYSSILDNRTVCTNPRWSELEETSKGKPLVAYRCTLEGGVDFINRQREDVLKYQHAQHESYHQNRLESVESSKDTLDYVSRKLAKLEEEGAHPSTILEAKRSVKMWEDHVEEAEEDVVSGKKHDQEKIAEIEAFYDVSSLDEVYTWAIKEDGVDFVKAEQVMVNTSGEEERRLYKAYPASELFELASESEFESTDGAVDIDTYYEQLLVYSML